MAFMTLSLIEGCHNNQRSALKAHHLQKKPVVLHYPYTHFLTVPHAHDS